MSWSTRTHTEATSLSTATATSTSSSSSRPESPDSTLSNENLGVHSEPLDARTFTSTSSDEHTDPSSDSEAETKGGIRAWLRRKPKEHYSTASKSTSKLPVSSSSSSSSSTSAASPVGLYPSGLMTEKKRVAPTTFGLLSSQSLKPPRSRAQPDEAGFYYACNLSELPIKKGVKVKLHKRSIAVFRLADGTIYAMENSCEHQGAALSCGTLMDIEDVPHVKCPGHNVKFNLKTGCANRGKWRQKVYETLIKREELWIRV